MQLLLNLVVSVFMLITSYVSYVSYASSNNNSYLVINYSYVAL